MGWPDIAGKFRVPLDDLISIIEHGSLSRTSLFARQSLEEQFVRYQLAWRTKLAQTVVLTNTNKQSRMFEIGVEFDHVQPQQQPYKVEFFIDHGYQQHEKMFLSTEKEEEIENLEQKPKKIKTYLKRLSKLKKQQNLSQLSSERTQEKIYNRSG
ncbi:hypothetical protein HPULCUR_010148 [Helicostylum pulchrum]|uniref:Uncharacterized protein n=1 Tax=Helicostylum pulchrum TaxID=562976 RepID=A0ABP9YCG0_9FUNG